MQKCVQYCIFFYSYLHNRHLQVNSTGDYRIKTGNYRQLQNSYRNLPEILCFFPPQQNLFLVLVEKGSPQLTNKIQQKVMEIITVIYLATVSAFVAGNICLITKTYGK
jgi:hypothetical protein